MRTVLVAEDSYLAALEISAALEGLGYSVLGPVATSEQALALVKEEPNIEFAILDVSLRGGNCGPIILELRKRGTPFVLATGFADPQLSEFIGDMPAPPNVRKPFSARALREAIELVSSKTHSP